MLSNDSLDGLTEFPESIREGLWPFTPPGDMAMSMSQTMDPRKRMVEMWIEFPSIKLDLTVMIDSDDFYSQGYQSYVGNNAREAFIKAFRYRPTEPVPDNVVLGEN